MAGGYTNPDTATADPSTRIVGILEEANGVYTYRFATDVSTPLLMASAIDKKNISLGKVANNGNLAVKDLPEAWRARYASDLGVAPPDGSAASAGPSARGRGAAASNPRIRADDSPSPPPRPDPRS